MKQVSKQVWLLMLIGMLAFVWGNSLLPSELSNALSDKLIVLAGGVPSSGVPSAQGTERAWLTVELVRKMAHVAEFCVLGVIGASLIRKGRCALAVFGMGAALTDETIQLFTERTSKVTDVWIDLGGFFLGVLILQLMRRFHKR